MTTLLLSIDWRLLLAFCALELVIAWVHWIDGGPWGREPEPRMDCVARGGKDHWTVSAGRVRTP